MDKYAIISGGDTRWLDGSPASVIINNDFFGDPVVDQNVSLPLIASTEVLFAPTVTNGGGTQNISLPLIASTGVLYPPKVGQATWTSRAGVTMTTNVGGFWEYKPPFYNDGVSSCVICFHGQGEQGDGNANLNSILNQGISKHINETMGTANQFPYDALVICPQYTGGAMTSGRVQGIINYVRANFTFNQARLHLTGLSLGSEGLTNWWFNGTLTHVASCSILCTPSQFYQPGADNAVAANMPTLFVHGTADSNPFTPFTKSQRWVEGYAPNGWPGLNGLGISPPSIYYPMAGYDHNCWNDFYASWWTRAFLIDGKDWYQWADQYSRSDGLTLPFIPSTGVLYPPTITGGDKALSLPLIPSTSTLYPPSIINDNTWVLVKAGSIPGCNRPSLCALSSIRVVLHDEGNDKLSVLEYNGTAWEELATITVASSGGHLAPLSSTDFAFIDGTNKKLRRYTFTGSAINLVGTELDLTSLALNAPALAALSSTRVVLVDQDNKGLRAYDWTGSTWAQVGNTFANAGGFAPDIVGLTSTRVVLWHGDDGNLSAYDFDGTNFSLYAQTTISFSTSAICKLSSSRLGYINDGIDTLAVIDLVGTSFVDQGITLALSNVFYPALAGLTINQVAFIDQNNDELRLYQYSYSAPADQNVSLPLIASTGQLFAPTVAPQAVTITLPAIASTGVLYAPTVAPGSVNVQLPLIGSTEQLFAPSISSGLTLSLPQIPSTSELYPPTVVPGSVTIQLPAIGSGGSLYTPTVIPGQVTITVPLIGSTGQLFTPVVTVDGGPQFVLLPRIESTSELFAPNLSYLQSLGLPLIGSTEQLYAPSVVPGGSTVALPLIPSSGQLYPPVVINSLFIVLPRIESTLQLFPPIIGELTRRARFKITIID